MLPAVRATCAIPGVLPPVKVDGRCLVDGGLLNGKDFYFCSLNCRDCFARVPDRYENVP